jgi:hypothetical protein
MISTRTRIIGCLSRACPEEEGEEEEEAARGTRTTVAGAGAADPRADVAPLSWSLRAAPAVTPVAAAAADGRTTLNFECRLPSSAASTARRCSADLRRRTC